MIIAERRQSFAQLISSLLTQQAFSRGLGGVQRFIPCRLAGVFHRRPRLLTSLAADALIWGIGGWAEQKYREEFGDSRSYANLPYFSNLDRFRSDGPQRSEDRPPRRFLYSGALTVRKGVDLLARAFRSVAAQHK